MRSARMLACVALAVGVACSGEKVPYAGGLMIAVQTDYSVPKDITAVGLYITSDGQPEIFGDTRQVAPNGEVKFPATIAVLAESSAGSGQDPRDSVKDDGEVRVLRDVITTVPKGRTGLLRTPLTWINEGSGKGNRNQLLGSASIRPLDVSDGFIKLTSSCPTSKRRSRATAPTRMSMPTRCPNTRRRRSSVAGTPRGTAAAARRPGLLPQLRTPSRSTRPPARVPFPESMPNNPNLTLAVLLPPAKNIGECRADGCLVPLDKGAGWTIAGPKIQLPPTTAASNGPTCSPCCSASSAPTPT